MSALESAEIVELTPVAAITIRETVPMADIASFFDRAFPALAGQLGAQGLTPLSAPYARYYGQPTDTADIEVGFPVSGNPVAADSVAVGELPGGRVAKAVMRGSYDGLGAAWHAMYEWILGSGETAQPSMWEVYVTEPSPDMDPGELVTELYWPLV